VFGRKQAAISGNPMNVTHTITVDGTCHACRTAVTATTDCTALMGQHGTFTGTTTHACGTEVAVTGSY
jgi:hypothetical protein